MRFWLGFSIKEEDAVGAVVSVHVHHLDFSSFNEAVESLSNTPPPLVVGQGIEANAYVVRAETRDEAADVLRTVVERHEASPDVKLVDLGSQTYNLRNDPPEIEPLSRLHGELCITHQIIRAVLEHTEPGELQGGMERHRDAIEDLGFELRVLQAEMLGHPVPQQAPRGPERLGYGPGEVSSSELSSFANWLAALISQLGITRHEVNLVQQSISSGERCLAALEAELETFDALVKRYAAPG